MVGSMYNPADVNNKILDYECSSSSELEDEDDNTLYF